MQNRDDQTQQIEIHIEHAKQIVAFGDAIERLVKNKDFQTVIDQGYMTDESRRLTLLLADPNIDERQHTLVMRSLQAISELNQFFMARRNMAEQMRKDLEAAEQELEAIAAEEHAEGVE